MSTRRRTYQRDIEGTGDRRRHSRPVYAGLTGCRRPERRHCPGGALLRWDDEQAVGASA